MTTPVAAPKRPKGRSPLYPAINLETAIVRARQLHASERLHKTNVATIVALWNYKSLNGPAAQTLAALKKYGLLDDEGAGDGRKAWLTSLADVILVHPDEAIRRSAIQEAALKPAMHRELWEKYHEDLPSDSNLRWELTHDRGFTETGATEFIPVYRATVAFAQLASQSPDPLDESDAEDGAEVIDNPTVSRSGSGSSTDRSASGTVKTWPIPLIDSRSITLQGEFPVSQRDWEQFLAVLEVMKPGLVRDHDAM